ncbi:MAG TPA: hypothetical protein VFF79_01375, partial [Conexibacter sp.]|nr:hypothetical protein [Conexibacter sp.]
MSPPSMQWSEPFAVPLLDDETLDHLASRLDLHFHGVNVFGASTVGHRFVADSASGSIVLRVVRQPAGDLAIELVTFGDVEVDADEMVTLQREVREALATLPATTAADAGWVPVGAVGAQGEWSRVELPPALTAVMEAISRVETETVEENRGSFTIEPLDRGFGYTFGNSLRRVLLSSLAGAAVTSVRIEGVAHEYSTIPGVKEDVTDIVLNLKGVVCRMHSDATEIEAPLVVTGPGEITAKDIDLPSGVEILNPDAHVATLE